MSGSSVRLQVAVRCKPFTKPDKLGVILRQNSPGNAEVQTINCEREIRLPFSYAWWSAYGYSQIVEQESVPSIVESTPLVDQETCYDQLGESMLKDLLSGHAVVLFAYGLSGSGKTFTVFGVDDAGDPDSWFNFDEPQPLWGLFPRLAYNLYKREALTNGFGASIKYFQNVHDTVRDLLSPAAVEKNFKEGMRLDKDGFMDISWCRRKLVPTWHTLREIIGQANTRKCISPTQFNWCSTRGHCILEFEVTNTNSGRHGRLYVCDLAGAEPAADIHYAKYKRTIDPETGKTKHEYIGRHPDRHKTTELQEQGKKINLSLSELTRFFRRLAELIKRKRFIPGQDLPGCNAFFLGRYLKKTILQAHTYLIAAVRPEVSYQNYTFSTLEFAHNASVVRLAPKKPLGKRRTATQSHITDEMERLKALLREANAKNETLKQEEEEKLALAKEQLSLKMKELEDHINKEEDDGREHEVLMGQIAMYHKRGILMAGFDEGITGPYLEKLDVDEFRSKRFLFPLQNGITRIGRNGDVRPLTFSIVADHCSFEFDQDSSSKACITLIGGLGKVYHNGTLVQNENRIIVNVFDRIVLGDCMTMMRWPGHEPAKTNHRILNEEEVFAEYQAALSSTKVPDLRRASSMLASGASIASSINKRMNQLGPIVEEVNGMLNMLNREMLTCSLAMHFELNDFENEESELLDDQVDDDLHATVGNGSTPKPVLRIEVHRNDVKHIAPVILDAHVFMKIHSLLKQEITSLHIGFERGKKYIVPESHRPFSLLYDHDFVIGTTTQPLQNVWSLNLYDNEEANSKSRRVKSMHDDDPEGSIVGDILYRWKVTSSLASQSAVVTTEHLIGSEWKAELEIIAVSGLKVDIDSLYCKYYFLGQTYTTDVISTHQKQSGKGVAKSDNFPIHYTCLHGLDKVTSQFVEYMSQETLQIKVVAKIVPHNLPTDIVGTPNKVIEEKIRNVFDIVTDLTSDDTPISEQGRLSSIREIESHSLMSEATKVSAVTAIKLARTDLQLREIIRHARLNDTHDNIMSPLRTHSINKSNFDKVRSVVKFVGKIKRGETQRQLQHNLDDRERDLDRALQDKAIMKKQQHHIFLTLSGFNKPAVKDLDDSLSDLHHVSDVLMSPQTKDMVKKAIENAQTNYELNALLSMLYSEVVMLLRDSGTQRLLSPFENEEVMENFQLTLQKKIEETREKTNEDSKAVDPEQISNLKTSLSMGDKLSEDQYNAALRAIEKISVQCQLFAVRTAVNNQLPPEEIEGSCALISVKSNQLKTTRSSLMNCLESMERLTQVHLDLKTVTDELREKLSRSEIKLKDSERELHARIQSKESEIANLMQDISSVRRSKDEIENLLNDLQEKYSTRRADEDRMSNTLSKEADAMNSRLSNIVETFSGMSTMLKSELVEVKKATKVDLLNIYNEDQIVEKHLTEAKAEIADKNLKIGRLSKSLEELTVDIQQQSAIIDVSQAKERSLENELAKLKGNLEEERQHLESTKKKVAEGNKTIADIDNEVRKLKSENSKYHRELAERSEELSDYKIKDKNMQAQIQSLNIKIEEQEQTIINERRNLKNKLSEATQIADEVEHSKQREIRKINKENIAMKERLEVELSTLRGITERKIKTLSEDLSASEESSEKARISLQEVINKLRAELEISEDTNSTLSKEKTKLDILVSSLSGENKDNETEINRLKYTIQTLKASSQSTCDEQRENIRKLNDDLKSMNKALNSSKDEASRIQEECLLVKNAFADYKKKSLARTASLEDANQDLQKSLKARETELRAKEADLEELSENAMQNAESRVEKEASEALLAQKLDAEKKLKELEQENAEHILELRNEMREARDSAVASAITDTKEKMKHKIENVTQEFEHATAQLRNLKREHNDMKLILKENQHAAESERAEWQAKTTRLKETNEQVVRKLEDRVSALTLKIRREDQQSKKRESELSNLRSEFSHSKTSCQNKILDLEQDVERLKDAAAEADQSHEKEIANAQKQIIQLRENMRVSKREADHNLKTSLKTVEEREKQTAHELGKYKDRLDDALEKIAALEAVELQLNNANAELESKSRECNRAKIALRECQTQVENLRAEVSDLRVAVQDSNLQEAEIERLRTLVEEGSMKQNSLIRSLQGRSHTAEARASRAETALAEESAKLRSEMSKLQAEMEIAQRRADTVEKRSERALVEERELQESQVNGLNSQIRKLQNENESLSHNMENLRSTHHANIMELQEKMTKEAEEFLEEERRHAEGERESLHRTVDAVKKEAEESTARREKSWLAERTYLRRELDYAREAAERAQKGLQTTMLEHEKYAIELDAVKSKLKAEKKAHTELISVVKELKTKLYLTETTKSRAQQLEAELESSAKASVYAKELETQLRDVEKQLQDALIQKSVAEQELKDQKSQSRISNLQNSFAKLRDRVESDFMNSEGEKDRDFNKDSSPSIGSSEKTLLNALTQDHRHALQTNSELRRELVMKEDELSIVSKKLTNERKASAQKIKSLTTILRQAQNGWTREREEILREKRRAEESTREFESAARMYSRISNDATKERDNAMQQLHEEANSLQKKSRELEETRRELISIRDENLALSKQSDILRREVSKVSDSVETRRQTLNKLELGLGFASRELSKSQRLAYENPVPIEKLSTPHYTRNKISMVPEKGSEKLLNIRAAEAIQQFRNFGSPTL